MMWSNRASRTVYTDVILYQRIWHDHDNRKTAVGLAAVRGARSVGGSVFSWDIVRGVAGWYNTVVFSAVNGTYIIRCSSIRCSSIRRCSIRRSSIHCSNIRHSVLAPRSGLVSVIQHYSKRMRDTKHKILLALFGLTRMRFYWSYYHPWHIETRVLHPCCTRHPTPDFFSGKILPILYPTPCVKIQPQRYSRHHARKNNHKATSCS